MVVLGRRGGVRKDAAADGGRVAAYGGVADRQGAFGLWMPPPVRRPLVAAYGGATDRQGTSAVEDAAAAAVGIPARDGDPREETSLPPDREDAIVAPRVPPDRELICPRSLYLQVARKVGQRPGEVHRARNPYVYDVAPGASRALPGGSPRSRVGVGGGYSLPERAVSVVGRVSARLFTVKVAAWAGRASTTDIVRPAARAANTSSTSSGGSPKDLVVVCICPLTNLHNVVATPAGSPHRTNIGRDYPTARVGLTNRIRSYGTESRASSERFTQIRRP